MTQTKSLTGGARERAVSLVLNHDCGSDKFGFEFLSREDQRLVRRIEREWEHEDNSHEKLVAELTRSIKLNLHQLP